jgi:hypothetical protein
MPNGQGVTPITVLGRYTNEQGEQEERYSGFLTGGSHALCLEEYNSIIFVEVAPTDEPEIYLGEPRYHSLGQLNESQDPQTIIEALANKLHSMMAYEFMAKVIFHVKDEIDFEQLIIPSLLQYEGGTANER